MGMFSITGKTRSRFVHAAVLLHMLDPVRSEAGSYGLDTRGEVEANRECMLKRKFLDSFALICSVKKGGDSVSAACMEELTSDGTVIRIAANTGVDDETLLRLRSIVEELNSIAGQVNTDRESVEASILAKIVRLDGPKIREYIKMLLEEKEQILSCPQLLESQITATGDQSTVAEKLSTLVEWIDNFRETISKPRNEPDTLIQYIRWAQKVKTDEFHTYISKFATMNGVLPKWVRVAQKLARFDVATKALFQLAFEFPRLFSPMVVESLPAPSKTVFPKDDASLMSVLRRVSHGQAEDYLLRLSRIWSNTEPNEYFRKQVPDVLAVHAEMQLIGYYEENPQNAPTLRFIGVSKKSCYLCDLFLKMHPEKFTTSACHQKLYTSWILPSVSNNIVYDRFKLLTMNIMSLLEAAASQHLQSRLGTPKKQLPADSSAGVSLSGLTNTNHRSDHVKPPAKPNEELRRMALKRKPSLESVHDSSRKGPTRPASVEMSDTMPLDTTRLAHRDLANSKQSYASLATMVLTFKRQEEAICRDILLVADIIDSDTCNPSWAKLIGFLEREADLGTPFQETKEFLTAENGLVVNNERKLRAHLQYLFNMGHFNSDFSICSRDNRSLSNMSR